MPRRFSLILVLALVLGSALLPLAQIIRAANLSLSATSGQAGTNIAVSGSGFLASSPVSLRWETAAGAVLATAAADASGSFTNAVITLPADATAGTHQIVATDGTTTATVSITMLPGPSITLSPDSGLAGTSVAVGGEHFAAGATITVRWDGAGGTVLATTVADASGAFSGLQVFIPLGASAGSHAVFASDGTLTASRPLTVLASAALTLSSTSALAGSVLEASGTGYRAGGAVTLRWDTFTGTVLATATADGSGSFSGAVLRVPAGATAGSHTIHAGDGTSNASAVLTVVSPAATLALTPNSQVAGGTVTATGTGFSAGESVSLRWESSGGTVLATATADGAGAFSAAAVTVPTSASAGDHAVVAVGGTSLKQAIASLTVTQTTSRRGSGSLSGQVVHAVTGQPIGGAVAILKQRESLGPAGRSGEEVVLQATSAGDGKFSFTQVAPGIYSLKVEATGFHDAKVDGITILDEQIAVVNVALRPEDGARHREGDGDDDDDNDRPGFGCGDRNHEHSGPSGHGGDRESPCDKNRGHDHEDADADDEGRDEHRGQGNTPVSAAAPQAARSVSGREVRIEVRSNGHDRDKDRDKKDEQKGKGRGTDRK